MKTINNLSSTDSLSLGDLLALWSTNNGDTRKASLNTLIEFIQAQGGDGDISTTTNFNSLKDIDPASNPSNYLVLGAITDGDGKGGLYYYDSLSALDEDNFLVIASDVLGVDGRWLRVDINNILVVETITEMNNLNVNALGSTKSVFVKENGLIYVYNGSSWTSNLDPNKDYGSITDGDVLQHRRGTVAENNAFTGATGEVIVDTTNNRLRVHDGVTVGGFPVGDYVNVKDYGAKGDGVTDDTAAIQALITAGINNIFFPKGTYLISEPLHFTYRVNIIGDKATIKADSGFVGKTFTDVGNSTTITLYGCIINVNGNYNDTGGSRANNSKISGIEFQCEDVADGIIIERFMDTIVENCNIFNAKDYGIINSTYTWGSRFNNIRIESFTTAGIYLREANNGIDISGAVIWGYPTRGSYGIQSAGNNNGVSISGSVIERVETGIYLTGRFGSMSFSGIDFEDTSEHNIYANCPDFAENRLAGPINITGCYFDSTLENINNNIALVQTQNCRFRTSPHFTADATYGVNVSNNNIFDGFNPVVSAGRFKSETNVNTGVIRKKTHYFNSSVDYNGELHDYYLSTDQRTARNAYINVRSSNQGGAADLHTSKVEIAAISTAYADQEYSTTGIVVNNIGSNRSLSPLSDNSIALGQSGTRWSVVYAGTGTINTSDDREKKYLDITDKEKQVALELKANMRKFKFNDAIEEKGEDKARIHFGASAQTVKTIFESYGLVAEDYAILCYDVWFEDEDGNILDFIEGNENSKDAIKKDRYGIRYEELLSFIISAI